MELLSIICSFGLETIDSNLIEILNEMSKAKPTFIESFIGIARIVGCCIALGIGSYECWMMMLGRRGMDVMKILRIIIISICITQSGFITGSLDAITGSFEASAKGAALGQAAILAQKEEDLAKLQNEYLEKLREVQDSLAKAEQVINHSEDNNVFEKIGAYLNDLLIWSNNLVKRATIFVEQKMTEWINTAVRYCGEIYLQVVLYGILVAQRIFLVLLAAVCPLMFALSLAPPWKSAWSQWMSKYISLSLWSWVAWIVLFYVVFIMEYFIQKDMLAYQTLINNHEQSSVGAIGLMGIGTTCMYVVALLVGGFVLKMVPEAASWLIPGGVSSGAGNAAGAATAMIVSHIQNSVSSTGTAGQAIAHPGTAAGKAVGNVLGAVGNRAAKNLRHNYGSIKK